VLETMIREGILTPEGALPYATNANNLLLKINDLAAAAPLPQAEPPKEEGSMLDMIER